MVSRGCFPEQGSSVKQWKGLGAAHSSGRYFMESDCRCQPTKSCSGSGNGPDTVEQDDHHGSQECSSTRLAKPGDSASMRFFFAFFRVDERNRDVTPIDQSVSWLVLSQPVLSKSAETNLATLGHVFNHICGFASAPAHLAPIQRNRESKPPRYSHYRRSEVHARIQYVESNC